MLKHPGFSGFELNLIWEQVVEFGSGSRSEHCLEIFKALFSLAHVSIVVCNNTCFELVTILWLGLSKL